MGTILKMLATVLMAEPITPIVMGVRTLVHVADLVGRSGLTHDVIAGTVLPVLAFQDVDPNEGACRVDGAAGAMQLHGRKRFVAGAAAANCLLVTALFGRKTGLVAVRRGQPGVAVDLTWRVDWTPYGVVSFDGVELRDGDIFQAAGAGDVVQPVLDEGAALAAAELLA